MAERRERPKVRSSSWGKRELNNKNGRGEIQAKKEERGKSQPECMNGGEGLPGPKYQEWGSVFRGSGESYVWDINWATHSRWGPGSLSIRHPNSAQDGGSKDQMLGAPHLGGGCNTPDPPITSIGKPQNMKTQKRKKDNIIMYL